MSLLNQCNLNAYRYRSTFWKIERSNLNIYRINSNDWLLMLTTSIILLNKIWKHFNINTWCDLNTCFTVNDLERWKWITRCSFTNIDRTWSIHKVLFSLISPHDIFESISITPYKIALTLLGMSGKLNSGFIQELEV